MAVARPESAVRWGDGLLAMAGTPLLRWLVARLAVPPGRAWRSACDSCGARIGLSSPNRGALLPSGRCRHCGERIGAPPYILEAVTVAAAALVVWSAPAPLVGVAGLWWMACAVPLVFIDLRVHRLPDVLTYPAAVGVLVLLTADAAISARWGRLASAALAAAVFGGVFLLAALLLGRHGLGLGDVKLMVSIAALVGWWGWGAAFTAVLLAFLAAGVVGGVLLAMRRVDRRDHMPMGPFFVGGAVAVLAALALTTAR